MAPKSAFLGTFSPTRSKPIRQAAQPTSLRCASCRSAASQAPYQMEAPVTVRAQSTNFLQLPSKKCTTLAGPLVPVWLGVSHVKCPDSRPPPGQRRGWRLFGRIHGASGPPARCGHCSDRQRRGLDQWPVVVSVQRSVRRYLLIADGLLLRAAASIWICRNVAPCCDGYPPV